MEAQRRKMERSSGTGNARGEQPNVSVFAGALLLLSGIWLLYQGVSTQDRPKASDTTRHNQSGAGAPADAPEVERSITTGRSAEELYRLWREPATLSQVMGHFAEVRGVGEGRTHWRVHAPLGRTLEWDTHVVEERENELIRWESLEGSSLPNEGSMHLRPAPGNRGTEVKLRFQFKPPGGVVGTTVAKLMEAVPKTFIGKALRRFKSLAETGEIPSLERNPSARGRGDAV